MLGVLKHTGPRRQPDGSCRLLNLGEIAKSSRGLSEVVVASLPFPQIRNEKSNATKLI